MALGKKYVADLENFEKFLLSILKPAFAECSDHPDINRSIKDEEFEPDEELDELISFAMGRIHDMENDLLCCHDISEALNNFPETLVNRHAKMTHLRG